MATTPLLDFLTLFTADAAVAERLAGRLALVLADPAAYETEYAEELLERGIDEPGLPRQELRDLALIDALLAEDLAWEADWKEGADDMADGLNGVLAARQHPARLDLAPLAARHLTGADALDALQDALEPLGLALVLFTLDSDSYPLGLVPDAQAADARQLASALGFDIAVY